jgi:MFS family permease
VAANPYAEIFRAPGAKGFSSAGLLGRLPLAMTGLGTILMIKEETGKYALAGLVAGTLALVQAVVGPFLARLIDRRGQAEVAFPMLAVSVAGLVSLILGVRFKTSTWTWFVSAAVTGASMPNIGSLVRTRWTKIYGGTPQLHTAYSFEAVMDEVVFVIGPILVTFLTLSVHHEAGVAFAALCLAVGTTALLLQKRTQPAPHPPEHHHGPSVFGISGIRILLVSMIAIGVMFGSVEVVTVAFAEEHDHADWAGLLLALYAGGSLLAGLVFGALHWTMPLHKRFVVLHCAVVVTSLPLITAPSIPVLAVVLLLAGFAISPTLITGLALVQFLVPPAQLTEGMVAETTGLALGVTAGSALSGWMIDNYGAHRSYLVPVAGSGLALLTALLGSRWLRQGHSTIE